MTWTIKVSELAAKQLQKLDKNIRNKIIDYLKNRVAKQKHQSDLGKALVGNKKGIWRYRVEDYRIICEIQDKELVILVLRLGHRKNVYD